MELTHNPIIKPKTQSEPSELEHLTKGMQLQTQRKNKKLNVNTKKYRIINRINESTKLEKTQNPGSTPQGP